MKHVEITLDSLAERPTPLAIELPRGPGQKEKRWAQLLGGAPEVEEADPGPPTPPAAPVEAAGVSRPGRGQDRIGALEEEVASLRAEVSALREELHAFRRQFE